MASRKMDGGNNHVRPRRRPRHKFGKVGRLKSRPAARSVAPLSFLRSAVGARQRSPTHSAATASTRASTARISISAASCRSIPWVSGRCSLILRFCARRFGPMTKVRWKVSLAASRSSQHPHDRDEQQRQSEAHAHRQINLIGPRPLPPRRLSSAAWRLSSAILMATRSYPSRKSTTNLRDWTFPGAVFPDCFPTAFLGKQRPSDLI
jgi:hypothetical protein